MKFWTEEWNAILREKYARGVTADLVKELGASSCGAVTKQANVLGLKKEDGFRSNRARLPISRKIIEALESGPMTSAQIGKTIGRSSAHVYESARRLCKSGKAHRTQDGQVVRAVHTCRGEE